MAVAICNIPWQPDTYVENNYRLHLLASCMNSHIFHEATRVNPYSLIEYRRYLLKMDRLGTIEVNLIWADLLPSASVAFLNQLNA